MADVIKKIEDYILQGNWVAQKLDDATWTINDEFEGIDNLVIYYEDPIVIFRLKLMEAPQKNKEAFFEKLLRLNTESMIHGAYALEGDNIILVDTLQGENLDFNEFQASIESIHMALANDYKVLTDLIK